jgi:3-hydroxyisobutyrate dehydrogenase
MNERIGYIGLGIMGGGMAGNLLEAGHDLVVWNRTTERATPFVEAGAEMASGPADLASRCGIVMICVSDTPDVEQVTLGEGGILEGLFEGTLIVDHSSISPRATVRLAQKVAERGGHWLDAPVSGGSEGAQRGTLSIMIGGDADQVERARPYLEAYGTTITRVGPNGAGQMAKLVNQVLVVVNALGVSEALLLAQAGGLDLVNTIEAVAGGAAGSWMLSNRGPQVVERDWRPGFTIDLQQKDLLLALDIAEELGVPLPATKMVSEMYKTLQQQGLGGEGNHALVKALEQTSGITVGG